VVQTRTDGLERASVILSVFEQVQTKHAEGDERHATGKRWAVAVVRFAQQGSTEHVAVEPNTPV
jgi:hypothetical protein